MIMMLMIMVVVGGPPWYSGIALDSESSVERSILLWGKSRKISSHWPKLSQAQFSLHNAKKQPKTLAFNLCNDDENDDDDNVDDD